MSNILNLNPATTMTSLEISDLVDSNHADVRRSIERLVAKNVISLPPLAEVKVQREQRAESVEVYAFSGVQGRRDSIVVVAQLSPEFTARIVDRWQELEAKEPVEQSLPPSLPSPAEDAVRVGTLLAIALNLHGTEKASMISRALQLKAPEYVSLMPAYATNAPRTTDGKLVVHSLSGSSILFLTF